MKLTMGSKGFSLVEVVIALFILAVSLLALAGLMVTTTRNNSFGGHMTEAVTFAQDKLEQLRAAPWASLIPGEDWVIGATGIRYRRSWTVADNPNGDLRWVTVSMNWTDPTARSAHTINVRSVVSQE
ncbi:MAG: type IV pilus modification PilV family protein [Thermodesulfobacteriota bacterium]